MNQGKVLKRQFSCQKVFFLLSTPFMNEVSNNHKHEIFLDWIHNITSTLPTWYFACLQTICEKWNYKWQVILLKVGSDGLFFTFFFFLLLFEFLFTVLCFSLENCLIKKQTFCNCFLQLPPVILWVPIVSWVEERVEPSI